MREWRYPYFSCAQAAGEGRSLCNSRPTGLFTALDLSWMVNLVLVGIGIGMGAGHFCPRCIPHDPLPAIFLDHQFSLTHGEQIPHPVDDRNAASRYPVHSKGGGLWDWALPWVLRPFVTSWVIPWSRWGSETLEDAHTSAWSLTMCGASKDGVCGLMTDRLTIPCRYSRETLDR